MWEELAAWVVRQPEAQLQTQRVKVDRNTRFHVALEASEVVDMLHRGYLTERLCLDAIVFEAHAKMDARCGVPNERVEETCERLNRLFALYALEVLAQHTVLVHINKLLREPGRILVICTVSLAPNDVDAP